MPETAGARVAVYFDFDNIVLSWYDRIHGRGSLGRDRARIAASAGDPEVTARLAAATVDVAAIVEYAASFGTLVLTRAYADWSAPINAEYRSQLVARAVDLVQLFPTAAYAKNGADIRLAVDAVEDMFRLPDLTHVVIVAGDSDYVPLAQRCKRLGRYVVGVGVAGSTAKALAAACDRFDSYESLPGVTRPEASDGKVAASGRGRSRKPAATPPADPAEALLERALRLERERTDDEWAVASALKDLIKRMDPSFSEKELGHASFTDFVKAHPAVVELREEGTIRYVRLNPARTP
ncbi:NYN domain-containing protein [Microbacterium sp.]|uniref:NYN domain-containing protein n=1 Tax=Microbacterium sp. TaxID=51671 RepID=UPI0039E44523